LKDSPSKDFAALSSTARLMGATMKRPAIRKSGISKYFFLGGYVRVIASETYLKSRCLKKML